MTVLKKIGIILGVFLLLFIILGIVMPKNLHVEKTETLDAPANYLYNIANDFKTNPDWNPWNLDDPKMVLIYGEKSEGIGASYSWTSEESGNGSATYTKVIPNEYIEAKLVFDGMDTSKYAFTFKPSGDKTAVTWSMDTRMGFPSNVMGPIFKFIMKRQYGKGLDALEALAKKRIEKKEYFGYIVKEENILERHYIISRSNVAIADIQKYFTQSLGAIFQKVQSEGLTMKGMPSSLFFNYDLTNGMTDMAAAIPVNEEKAIKDLSSITIPKQTGLVIDYYGDFANTGVAHSAMTAYMKDRSLLTNTPSVEEYVTDPLKEKDPSKWLTRVIYYYSKNGM